MTLSSEADEFERIELVAKIERARMFVVQYEENQDSIAVRSRTVATSWAGLTSGWEGRRHERGRTSSGVTRGYAG